jgi:PAS domain-containing protein
LIRGDRWSIRPFPKEIGVLALHDNEELYRDLVEHSIDLICTHDLSSIFLTVNLAAARSLGLRFRIPGLSSSNGLLGFS